MMNDTRNREKPKLLRAALKGMQQNILPGLVLQAVALGIVFAYYFTTTAKTAFEHIALLKTDYGFLFSALSTAFFGGLIPYLYLLATKQISEKSKYKELLFYILFWAWKGVEVDAFYRLQGLIFGYEPSIPVIIQKTLVDQFIYSPLLAAPTLTIAFLWKDCDFSFTALRQKFTKKLFTFKIPSVQFSSWIIWMPAVAVIYCLPMALQVPMFNLVLCFYVLLLNFVSRHNNRNS